MRSQRSNLLSIYRTTLSGLKSTKRRWNNKALPKAKNPSLTSLFTSMVEPVGVRLCAKSFALSINVSARMAPERNFEELKVKCQQLWAFSWLVYCKGFSETKSNCLSKRNIPGGKKINQFQLEKQTSPFGWVTRSKTRQHIETKQERMANI